jgi:hypothetical protein
MAWRREVRVLVSEADFVLHMHDVSDWMGARGFETEDIERPWITSEASDPCEYGHYRGDAVIVPDT